MLALTSSTFAVQVVVYISLLGGVVSLAVGSCVAWREAGARNATRQVAKKLTDEAVAAKDELQQQGAITSGIDSVAKLAVALKDLDVGTRIMTIGLALITTAAIAAGLDAVAAAIGSK